jgi:hypothetical protein
MPNLFQDSTKTVPTSDAQIVRVGMEEIEIGGRKSRLPAKQMSPSMTISHVPNAGSTK